MKTKTYQHAQNRNIILIILAMLFVLSLGHRFNSVMDEHQSADHELETFIIR